MAGDPNGGIRDEDALARAGPGTIILAGATASGKSALALALARRLGGTIINADSMQVYRELRVLSARPTVRTMRAVPHRLYGVLSAREGCTAARWRDLALAAIEEAWRAGRIPIVTGGTGFYLKALEEGLAPIPDIPAIVREEARARLDELGVRPFHRELAMRDPVTAARLAPGDSQRMIRAWEVVEATGRPLSEWLTRSGEAALAGPRLRILLEPDRAELYRSCDERFGRMMRRGAVAEVRRLLAAGLNPESPAMKAVGVRELAALIEGRLDRAAAVAAARQATRRYAKRQGTWFRHQFAADLRLERADESAVERSLSDARRFGLTLPR
jgi:tRNA dimethylallyltransferase